jgi:hypothetical protein
MRELTAEDAEDAKENDAYKSVLLSAAKRSEKDLVLPKRNSGAATLLAQL